MWQLQSRKNGGSRRRPYDRKPRLVAKLNCLLAKPDDQAAKVQYKTTYSTLQAKLVIMQNDWWKALAERTPHYVDISLDIILCG